MKKILIAGIVIIAGAAVTAPYLIGAQAEKRFAQDHKRLQQEMFYPQLSVEAGEFKRGWFKSEASTQFTFTPPEKDAESIVFEFQHHISQLPSLGEGGLMTIESELVLPPEAAKEMKKYFNKTPLLSAHSVVKFDGSEVSTLSSPSYSGPVKDDESAQLVWQGLKGTVSSDAEARNVSLSLHVPTFSYQDQEGKFEVSTLNYNAELERGKHNLWYGNADGSLEKVALNTVSEKSGPTSILVNKVALTSNQKENGPLVDISGKFTVDSADFNGFKIENGIYDVAYKNLDAASLGKLNDSIKQVMREQPENPNMLLASMMPHVKGLLSKKPELNINQLALDTPLGKIHSKVHLALLEELEDQVMQDPTQLLNIMNVDIEASLPKPMVMGIISSNARNAVVHAAKVQKKKLTPEELAKQVDTVTQQQLQGMLAQKLMVEDGANYATAIHYVPQKLVINEQDATPMISGLLQ